MGRSDADFADTVMFGHSVNFCSDARMWTNLVFKSSYSQFCVQIPKPKLSG